jgi:hypothetical protein
VSCFWRHRFDADPDPYFHVEADPHSDPDPHWHRNDADPHAAPTPKFCICCKIRKKFLLLVTAMPVYNVLSFSSVSKVSQFSVFCTAFYQLVDMLGIVKLIKKMNEVYL